MDSGTCGPNLTWTLDKATGILTISGSGEMDNYDSKDLQPWNNNADYVTTIIVKNGVTTIGDCAFSELSLLDYVELPPTVTAIGENAFKGCLLLKKIILPGGMKIIKEHSFSNTGLRIIYLPNSIERIERNAFLNDFISHVCYEGDKNAWLNISIDLTGNNSVNKGKTKIHYNSQSINDFPLKDWWGFSNHDIKENHHIDRYVWLSVLGANIFEKLSGWGFGDKNTEKGLCA
jgi:hypothetical protein